VENNQIILGTVLLTSVIVITGIAMESGMISEDSSLPYSDQSKAVSLNSSEDVSTTAGGKKYTVHPDELVQGCPGMDCIPSIDDPKYVEAEEADWLDSGERIIGLEIDNKSKAYPLSILSRHEIVNDRVAGEPVAVTYCPLCRSGVTYSRDVNGEILEFGVSGKLHEANLVMYDRQTESYWSQISGKAIVGEKVPQKLDLIFSSITTWEEWISGHPEAEVLSRDTGIYPASAYEGSAYSGYRDSESVGFGVKNLDDRLPPKKLVHGIKISNTSKAYTEDILEQKRFIQDEIEGKTVLIFKHPEDGSVTALAKNDTELEFKLADEHIEDSEGGHWSFEGEKLNSEASVERVIPQGFYWFAWSNFNPETKLYRSN
jgi:hypothetical protein